MIRKADGKVSKFTVLGVALALAGALAQGFAGAESVPSWLGIVLGAVVVVLRQYTGQPMRRRGRK